MPTYEYECENCGHKFSELHAINIRLKTCPNCHKESLIRLIGTGLGIIFNGTGFYATDYKKGDNNENNEI